MLYFMCMWFCLNNNKNDINNKHKKKKSVIDINSDNNINGFKNTSYFETISNSMTLYLQLSIRPKPINSASCLH